VRERLRACDVRLRERLRECSTLFVRSRLPLGWSAAVSMLVSSMALAGVRERPREVLRCGEEDMLGIHVGVDVYARSSGACDSEVDDGSLAWPKLHPAQTPEQSPATSLYIQYLTCSQSMGPC